MGTYLAHPRPSCQKGFPTRAVKRMPGANQFLPLVDIRQEHVHIAHEPEQTTSRSFAKMGRIR